MRSPIRTRIAPSPTGFPHIGTIYQTLFDYAFAHKHNGQFIVRIEDTDRSRIIADAEQVIYDSLDWFRLIPDESPEKGGPYGPYRQSERLDIYRKHAQELVNKEYAYYCFCTPERLEDMRRQQQEKKQSPMYDKRCLALRKDKIEANLRTGMPYIIRMKIPEDRIIAVEDVIVGTVEFDSNLIDHQVILKSDGFPTYHLAVVVDDHLMHITHVIRGREWLSSTPKHVLLYEFFGWDIPHYAHLPLILNPDGKGKLSKRHGHASVEYYRTAGYLPEAVLNYLSNIVWNHPKGKEIYPLEEFMLLFRLEDINSQGARFDVTKLDWMNGEYIRHVDTEDLVKRLKPFVPQNVRSDLLTLLVPIARERIKKLSEFSHYLKPFIAFHRSTLTSEMKRYVTYFLAAFSLLDYWNAKRLESVSRQVVQKEKMPIRDAFMALRLAATGERIGLPLFETFEILGKTEVLNRLKEAT